LNNNKFGKKLKTYTQALGIKNQLSSTGKKENKMKEKNENMSKHKSSKNEMNKLVKSLEE